MLTVNGWGVLGEEDGWCVVAVCSWGIRRRSS